MPANKYRVIVDTNLWISFLLTKGLGKMDFLLSADELTLLFSSELADEFTEVALRPKFRKYFSLPDLQSLLIKIEAKAAFIAVTSDVDICRDPKDNFLLTLALDDKATHLLTGDKDLLILGQFNETRILTIADFLLAN